MTILADYHMHTPRCKHAAGPLEAYVEKGIAIGLQEIGFSDHNPLPHGWGASVRMDEDELDDYVADVLRLRERYRDQIDVRLGIEMDYVEGLESYLEKQAAAHPWDYIIGSVHYLDANCSTMSWPRQYAGTAADLYQRYYQLVRQMAETGFYDFVAHFDLPKRSGRLAPKAIDGVVDTTLRAVKAAGVGIEINTSGYRHAELVAREPYPNRSIIQQAIAIGVSLTVNSDSHAPDQVGTAFDDVSALLRELGCERLVRYQGRRTEAYALEPSAA
ncbi:MAG: histidinol-phosphatase [Verrucomicrobia bacterium]|nr:histidinol-phosphatase [Verrucomicrobiota bacterium]